MKKTRWFYLLTVLAMLLTTVAPLAASPDAVPFTQPLVPNLTQVNVAGSFEEAIGGANWANNDPLTDMADANGDGVWKFSVAIPVAGNYEYKIVEDGDWGKAHPAANVPFAVGAGDTVRWYYDPADQYVADSVNKAIATVPGSFQSELGCPGDWQPECLRSLLKGPDGEGKYSFTTTAIPAGNYEGKVAINEGWDENYGQGGAPGGDNYAFTVAANGDPTKFEYDPVTHILTIAAAAPPGPGYSVALVGSLQSELGCAGDWDPACDATELNFDAADDVWQRTFDVPAGSWEYKVALNNSWDENYGAGGAPGGANIPLNLADPKAVKFYYDHKSHWITDNVNSVIATVPGSFQSELGCPGDWQPDCLRSWLQDPDGDGIYAFATTAIPAGSYEGKVAINEGWDENYGQGGAPGGNNYAFTVAADGDETRFEYDAATHILTITTAPIPPVVLEYAIIHYNRPAADYDGWGLHLWGDAIHPDEGTTWDAPKLFSGFDDYGAFVAIRLQDPTKSVNYIIHKGNDKDTPNDRSFIPALIPELWLKQGDAANYASRAAVTGKTVIHYNRPGGDYDGWGLHLWGDAIAPDEATDWGAPKLPTGFDDYGAYFEIALADPTKPVNFLVHKGDDKDPDGDRSYVPAEQYEIWLRSGDATIYKQRGAAEGYALIHYRRAKGDYDGWGLHLWTGSAEPGITWGTPLMPTGTDAFGVFWKVRLTPNATQLAYIIHKGDEKDPGPDQFLVFADKGYEIWQIQGAGTQYNRAAIAWAVATRRVAAGDLTKFKAHWVNANTIAWAAAIDPTYTYRLHYAADGGMELDKNGIVGGESIELTFNPAGLPDDVKQKFPHLALRPALNLAAADRLLVPAILKGQMAVSATDAEGNLVDATGLQIPGVLDDLYTYGGELGVAWEGATPVIRLWAPTAKSVKLRLFPNSIPATEGVAYDMYFTPDSGVWTIRGEPSWKGQYYLFDVEVYIHSTGKVEHNLVTDPYSLSLSTNSKRSQIVNLADAALKPAGWETLAKPPLAAPEDITIYELHIRDFSANDLTVPEAWRGTYKAFTLPDSDGMQHLQALAEAGLTHLHLLPAFDIATINENKAEWQAPDPDVLATYPPDSDQQQAALNPLRDLDGYNWGYDPFHYTVPEGSYSTDPDGATRIVEFREMVQALNQTNLRVVMDVVYNHTNAAGQSPFSVLDRIVPGYYHRLNDNGQVETSTCCANTASEHAMFEKLMVDSLVTWAKEYKVDGFRFDLMGHHMVSNMVKVRQALDALTLEDDGVDGKSIYLYGEGWNFGEVQDNARGVNATQFNMGGLGIGTFSDRLRDAVRGGGPFDGGNDLVKNQGLANGLYYDPNALNTGSAAEKTKLLQTSDLVRLGLAGNLRDYKFVDYTGKLVDGTQVDYNGSPAGYTLDPQEQIVYISKHDNQTLYDNNVYKAPVGTSMADRVRMQQVGLSIVALSQGVPFFHAGSDILRSKSLDRDSYNSGDWFNKLDWTYQTNNFGVGLPPAGANEANWDIMRPFLANAALKPAPTDIDLSRQIFLEWLQIRKSSPFFRLQTADQVQTFLRFLNTGPDQIPGLIVMSFSELLLSEIDPNSDGIVVLFNANDEAQTFSAAEFVGRTYSLHPVQANGVDPVVKTATFNPVTGAFSVPARTTAVFVRPQAPFKLLLPLIFKDATWPPTVSEEDAALAQPAVQVAAQDNVMYFVLTDRFANGDTANDFGADAGGTTVTDTLRHGFLPTNTGYFHGGDLAGLTGKLDYLKNMGVNALWITPPVKNKPVQGDGTVAGSTAGYHGYWGLDFLAVDPHLGAQADFAEFIQEAHSRGIKVYLDVVVNHTADVIQYEGDVYTYRNKANFPYKDAGGNVFDDRDYVGAANFPALDAATSFPYVPFFASEADKTIKNPAWLNNPIYYHNRGNSTFTGESSTYGDFFGLDDTFSEHPTVVNGFIEIAKHWIDQGVDGFRLDTAKHVNIEFWQQYAPPIAAYATAAGKPDFFMFGEVYDGEPAYVSAFTTAGKLPGALDFGFQGAATAFAARGAATNNLRDFFAKDDYYTDADSNAYSLAKFVSNHDLGRLGYTLREVRPTAIDAELLARTRLAYALTYFTRGFPVVYYGDEQGFVGGGSDRESREDMMPSQVASYNDNDLIGTANTTADDNFDPTHPLYQTLKAYGELYNQHTALRRGAQIHRYSAAAAGVYAFSRLDPAEKVEYVLAFNNATVPQRVVFPTYMAGTRFMALYPAAAAPVTTGADKQITLEVPALSFVIYKAAVPVGAAPVVDAAAKVDWLPGLTFTNPAPGGDLVGRAELAVALDTADFVEVTFAVKQGDGAYQVIGVDNNPPYRVFYDVSGLADGTELTLKAVAKNLFGEIVSATTTGIVKSGAAGDAGYAIIHYNRPAGDYDGWGLHLWGNAIDPSEGTGWDTPKPPNGEDRFGVFWFIKLADPAQPVNFIIHKGNEKDTDPDRAMIPQDGRQIWLAQGDTTNHPSAAAALGKTIIHYKRADGDYTGWGLHLWGDAIDPTEATDWATPKLPTGTDAFGATFEIKLKDPTKPVNFIVHKGDTKDVDPDRSYIPAQNAEVWLLSGDVTVYKQQGAAEKFVILHYHRPAGDYGDYTSANYADFWGLHTWGDADDPGWATPRKKAGDDAFGVYFKVQLTGNFQEFGYILHRGDTKDLPDNQTFNVLTSGYEAWLLQSTPQYLLPMP